MLLEWISGDFSIAKWTTKRKIEDLDQFSFWSRTDKELSLVCPTNKLPNDVEMNEDGWKLFRVSGKMEFSLVGILSQISGCLAKQKISIFAISTYDTDYILIKEINAKLAQEVLESEGWDFVE
ncbi:ACT domain-containing protein [Anaerotignum sp.]|uniref:ACT domain-containing protein n=1 Tax=Anaerotignum sp. TaxID=2039241 RepID=UPI00331C5700